MRWFVTGAGGQLATQAEAQLRRAGDEVVVLGIDDLDITDRGAVFSAVRDARPDVVVNAAAYTAVDAAESDEATAFAVNEDGPRYLAEAVREHGGRLLHVSTDYVFDGFASQPYEVDDAPDPRTVYGRSKLAGEQRVRELLPERSHVVRTAWVYGGPTKNFVDTMRRLESERETVSVVADQFGGPTRAHDLAAGLLELGRSDVDPGILHFVNDGQASWYDLAREVFRLTGADPDRVRPTDSAAYPSATPRPQWSVLSTRAWTAVGLTPPRPWRDALAAQLT